MTGKLLPKQALGECVGLFFTVKHPQIDVSQYKCRGVDGEAGLMVYNPCNPPSENSMQRPAID